MFVSHDFFGMIGVRPALGRLFLPEEDDPENGDLVAVLGHSLWKRRFGGDSSIVGQTVRMNRHSMIIVGVAQEGFRGTNAMIETGVWLPIGVAPAEARSIQKHLMDVETSQTVLNAYTMASTRS